MAADWGSDCFVGWRGAAARVGGVDVAKGGHRCETGARGAKWRYKYEDNKIPSKVKADEGTNKVTHERYQIPVRGWDGMEKKKSKSEGRTGMWYLITGGARRQ